MKFHSYLILTTQANQGIIITLLTYTYFFALYCIYYICRQAHHNISIASFSFIKSNKLLHLYTHSVYCSHYKAIFSAKTTISSHTRVCVRDAYTIFYCLIIIMMMMILSI